MRIDRKNEGMKMKTRKAFLPAILGLIPGLIFVATVPFTASVAFAQAAIKDSTPSPDADRAVTLDVVVTDKAGAPVAGLDPKAFTVLDNKKPLSPSLVREVNGSSTTADPPVEVILLFDNINLRFETISTVRRNLADYLQKSGGHLQLPTSLFFLTDQGLKMQGKPTRDSNVLLANLESNPTLPRAVQQAGGYQSLADLRQRSLTALDVLAVDLSKRPGRKLVVWITTGWASFEAESSQKSPKEREELFTFIVGMSNLLHQANITLYSIDPVGANESLTSARNFHYMDFIKGVDSPKHTDNADLLLQVMATQTGGKVLFGNNDVSKLIDQCIADVQPFYEVTFIAPVATQPNEYHALQVQVDKPGLKARSRTGYYAQP
jgi:VWFA-related protein